MIKIIIQNEESLTLDTFKEGKGKDWQHDWDALILPHVEAEKPCFMLYKIELKIPEFIFICFIPDNASTRQKMIYSSTKAALKVKTFISSLTFSNLNFFRPNLEVPT